MGQIADEAITRQRKDGIIKPKFLRCSKCDNITESYEYVDKCKKCKYKGEHLEFTTLENAQKPIEKKPKSKSEQPEINIKDIPQFKDPQLLQKAIDTITLKHKCDNPEKATLFVTCLTAYDRDPRKRQSVALVGDSGVGKDNLSDSVLEHLPESMKVTRATSSTLEDDIQYVKIISFSELNANRENGANKEIVETLKQLTEGGTSSLKKDVTTGFRTTRHSQQEQKTIIFGTTESRRDEELETRFITISVKKDSRKIQIVNESTLKTYADPDLILENLENQQSWLRSGLLQLEQISVIIPFAPNLINIFDQSEPRSQRDVKRLMALTAAHARLYQLQRPIWQHKNGKTKFIIAYPIDFINVYKIASTFFNMTYKGLESRFQDILDTIETLTEGDFDKSVKRIDIEKALAISKPTLRKRLEYLRNNRFVEIDKNDSKEFQVCYKRCKIGCKRLLIGVNLQELKKLISSDIFTLYHPYCTSMDKLLESESAEIDTSTWFDSKGEKNKLKSTTPLKNYTETQDLSESDRIFTSDFSPIEESIVISPKQAIISKLRMNDGYMKMDELFAGVKDANSVFEGLKNDRLVVENPVGVVRLVE